MESMMNNDTQTQEAQEENFVYEVEDETPVVEKKLETKPEKEVEKTEQLFRKKLKNQKNLKHIVTMFKKELIN